MLRKVIVWFRSDLRLEDNEALCDAISTGAEIIPVYIFDPRLFSQYKDYSFLKTGINRARFLIQSVQDLKENLQKLGSDLVVGIGKPEVEIFKIARENKTNWVFCNRERTQEEIYVQDSLEKKLWSVGQEMRYSRGKMLYYTADLPFPVTHTPDNFTSFKKEVEKIIPIRTPLPTPLSINKLNIRGETGTIPSITELGYSLGNNIQNQFRGGESEANKRIEEFCSIDRNESKSNEYLSRLSPWLSMGCLSPKVLYHKCIGRDKGFFDDAINSLLIRDFHRLMAKKYGNRIFQKTGIRGQYEIKGNDDLHLLKIWIEGRTGIPIIDAIMKELKSTGQINYSQRRLVSSFLIHDLEINWWNGAAYFESALLDYDPCSNWGNWNMMAGVYSDKKEPLVFNINAQARKLDPTGNYAKTWLPELSNIPGHKIHSLDSMTNSELNMHNVILGKNYPKSLISIDE